ncbi:FHIPEP family type III secretion protein [Numidum massiliense]|uniref:FHIPEP family type III secretion protein n=1 Tax=Numidum massiliense TaxID=1522315 RepID=UPI0006D58CF6|nr:FHIPEP family type III secretion protein [Numidum massiliense]
MNDWSISDAYSKQKYDVLALELGASLYDTLFKQTDLAIRVQHLRQRIMGTHGLFVPAIRIKPTELAPHRYVVRTRGQLAGEGVLRPPLLFSSVHEEGEPGVHPVTNEAGVWTDSDGTPAADLLLDHLLYVMEKKAPDLLTFETASRWWLQARTHTPLLYKELEKRGMTTGLMWQVMRKLLAQRIPLHPFEQLLETIVAYYVVHPPQGHAPPEWSSAHPDDIVKYVAKQKKKRLPPPKRPTAVIHRIE